MTSPDISQASETEPAPPVRKSAGQTYLIGTTVYLRGLELEDAKYPGVWRTLPYPISSARAEEILKEEVPKQAKDGTFPLVVCRIADDVPLGTIIYSTDDWRIAEVTVTVSPLHGERATAAVAEAIGLAIPWLLNERNFMVLWLDLSSGQLALIAAAEAAGMTRASSLREFFAADGVRHDLLTYEALNPAWIERLGDPRVAPLPRTGTGEARPVPPPVQLDGEPPPGAVMVGQRVYLRPIQPEDAARIALWSRQDSETFYDNGRHVRSEIGYAHWSAKLQEEEPPEWIRFAIVLRDGDELIGNNGLSDIDWVHKTAETESDIVRPEYRGGGYGSEAKHLLLAYAFERLGLHMVRSFVWVPNTRSAAALRKQGYREAGRFHWTFPGPEGFSGDISFDLLAREWLAMPRG